MEMDSSSLSESGGSSSSPPNSSSELLNGLKFGQKIYFEVVGCGAPANSGCGSSSTACFGGSSAAAQPKKGRGGVVQGSQPPRCQVEGCKVDLSDAKAYYSRHKVCGMHSKTPKVIVAGLEQRFCQQCSRFHQLPEFDQGKRSCRRRLAGHNERRRKPPPGSILSARYDRLSSSVFENSGSSGGFLMDFTAYPRDSGRDAWPTTKSVERVPGHCTATAKYLPHPWHSNSMDPPSDLFQSGSAGGTSFPSPGIPLGECFTGVSTDSSCALSLLSNQPWDSRNRASSLGVNDYMNIEGVSVAQLAAPQDASVTHYPNTSWGFKGIEAGSSSSLKIPPDLGLGHLPRPDNSHFSAQLELSQQSRHYIELEHSRVYDSAQQMNWSL